MILIAVGEMLAFPFTNNFAMNRALSGSEDRYLALYSMAFSCAHIFSAKTGMEIIDRFGFFCQLVSQGRFGFVGCFIDDLVAENIEFRAGNDN